MTVSTVAQPSIPEPPPEFTRLKERLSTIGQTSQLTDQYDQGFQAQRRLNQQQQQQEQFEQQFQQSQDSMQRLIDRSRQQTEMANRQQQLNDFYSRLPRSSAGTVYTGSGSVAQQMAYNGGNITSGNAQGLINFAAGLIGTPYSWGGGGVSGPSKGIAQGRNTVGFDCSGFVQYVYNQIGIRLPRTAAQQFKSGKRISADQARPGDLVFMNNGSHIAIYIGGGKIIESPRTGLSVRVSRLPTKGIVGFSRVGPAGFFGSSTGAQQPLKKGDELNRFIGAIRTQESHNNYKAVNRTSGALGAYQVMPSNVKSWSKQALGYSITTQQFLKSPKLQDQIARHMLSYYYRRYGLRGAAIAWYAGEGAAKKMHRVSGGEGYPDSYEYVDQVLRHM